MKNAELYGIAFKAILIRDYFNRKFYQDIVLPFNNRQPEIILTVC